MKSRHGLAKVLLLHKIGALTDTFRSYCGRPRRVGAPFLGLHRLLSDARGPRKRDLKLK